MLTPYDWQEGIGNRAQFIEGKLAQGAPVLAVSLEAGILVLTYRRQSAKIFEVYDRLIFAGLGQQSDVEGLRVAALEFASREGYSRSEEDVTIQRVATAMSTAVKRAFNDFGTAPFVALSLFAEVNETPEQDIYYVLEYDGDYLMARERAVLAGVPSEAEELLGKLASIAPATAPDEALSRLRLIWEEGRSDLDGLTPEATLLERSGLRENRFQRLLE
jgi:proteasome alpha subunit